ncbi:HAD family hydrolase [Campylobacter porcelli]|uniref:HAD family hydrolase n=1 Tax=Campylobacter porcelli TaxID=1660073 RepID=UPI000A33F518|nr:HAD family hydrolase [Campylobacter sp. P0078]
MSRVIIFDMDGTLVDSDKAICNTINYMRQGLNMPPLDDNEIIEIINNPAKNYMMEFYAVERVSQNMIKIFEEEYQKNYFLHAKIYQDALDIMDYFQKMGYKMTVASNAPDTSLNQILSNLKILDKFEIIVGASATMPCKPAPDMLNFITNRLGNQAIFIGDSYKDKLAAKNAKIEYINVTWGANRQILDSINCQNAKEVIEKIDLICKFDTFVI